MIPVLAYRVLELERRAEEDRLSAVMAKEDVETDFKEMEKVALTERKAVADAFKGLDSIYVKKESVRPALAFFSAVLTALAGALATGLYAWLTHGGGK